MHAATVVADHAAQRAARVRRRVGRIGQMMFLGGLAQPIENDSRLDDGQLALGIERGEPVHVPRVIKDHGHIGALPGQAGSSTARQNRRAQRPARGQRRLHVRCIPRNDDANGQLPVVGGVRRIQRARAHVEPHFAADDGLETRFQLTMCGEAFMIELRQMVQDRKRAHVGILTRWGTRFQ